MFKLGLVLAGLFAANLLFAQERRDSLFVNDIEAEFLYHDLFNFSEQSSYGPLLPDLFDLKPQFGWKNPLSLQPRFNFGVNTTGTFTNVVTFSPFVSNFSINNSASYKLNSNLSLTGSSYSANSIFNPVHTLNPSQMNFQGVNLYLEYKISDKFRIGGGVSVNRNSSTY